MKETEEVLLALQSITSMIQEVDKKLDSQTDKLDHLYNVVSHHDRLLGKLDLDSIPSGERLDILEHLKTIEKRLDKIDSYNNVHRAVDGIVALYATLIGIYAYWQN